MPHLPVYRYCVIDIDPDSWFSLKPVDPCMPDEEIASEAGKDYHEQYDGWEISYPLMIALRDEAGKDIGRFIVEREFEPVFSAKRSDHAQTP